MLITMTKPAGTLPITLCVGTVNGFISNLSESASIFILIPQALKPMAVLESQAKKFMDTK